MSIDHFYVKKWARVEPTDVPFIETQFWVDVARGNGDLTDERTPSRAWTRRGRSRRTRRRIPKTTTS
jgi:hypothetical protein